MTLLDSEFDGALAHCGRFPLLRGAVRTVQVNLGRRCNQACRHCHVEAGPARRESMDRATLERVIGLVAASDSVETIDITGGAPELHPQFRILVREIAALGRRAIDRCNLTVLLEPGQEDTAEFLAEWRVAIVASLPCYSRENVDRQRGRDVFTRSIAALRRLNRLGYARPGSGLDLDLVYNPQGPELPPSQEALEARYRDELASRYGVRFGRLFALANCPLGRFASDLDRQHRLESYQGLLRESFNERAVAGLMCRQLVSIAWDGRLHDCDFHQMSGLPLGREHLRVWDLESFTKLDGRAVATAAHCFACTAGAGSSCTGALA
ncbi:MAG: arsenosugar biosynthesis radical SAM (seleno)protein ArsS [Myxococcota bacterium]